MKLPYPSEVLSHSAYDVRIHYERVKGLFDRLPFKDEKECEDHALNLVLEINERANRKIGKPFIRILYKFIREFLKSEGLYQPTFREMNWNYPPSPNFSRIILRPNLERDEKLYSAYETYQQSLREAVVELLVRFVNHHAPEVIEDDTWDQA